MVHNRFHSGYMPWCGADVGGGYWTRDGSDTREQNVEKYRAFHDEDCGRVRAATDRDERDATEYYRCRACRDFFQRRLGRSRVRGEGKRFRGEHHGGIDAECGSAILSSHNVKTYGQNIENEKITAATQFRNMVGGFTSYRDGVT